MRKITYTYIKTEEAAVKLFPDLETKKPVNQKISEACVGLF